MPQKPKSKPKSKIDWEKFFEEYCEDPNSYLDVLCYDPLDPEAEFQ